MIINTRSAIIHTHIHRRWLERQKTRDEPEGTGNGSRYETQWMHNYTVNWGIDRVLNDHTLTTLYRSTTVH